MRARRIVALAALALGLSAGAAGQSDPWYARAPRLQVLTLQSPAGNWRIEYPRKDWIVALGGGATLAVLVQKNAEALVVLERTRMNVDLGTGELTDFFLTAEAELLKRDQPSASAFQQRIVASGGSRVYVVQFERAGLKEPNRVRQYSLPVGQWLYRLVCSAPRRTFAKYDAMFAHMAASLAVKAGE